MYTIIMDDDKNLVTTVRATLYQREKLADKIQFLFPQQYGEINIADCIILLKYVDQGNVAHAEKLIKDEDLYKDRIRCCIDVDTNLTRFSGDIKFHLDFLKLNTDDGIYESVLSSGETTITISPLDDYFAFTSDESLDVINQAILELDAKSTAIQALAESLEESKVDDLSLDGSLLQVSAKGTPIGKGVNLPSAGIGEEGIPVVEFGANEEEEPEQPEDPGDSDDTDGRDVVEF